MSSRPLQHRLEYLAFQLLRAKWSLLPEALAVRTGAVLGVFLGSVLRFRRRDVDRNLARVFPNRPPAWRHRVARASYAHLGREAVAVFRAGGWSPERLVERTQVVGFEPFRRAAASGKGVILLTGHLGNWELGGAAIAARGIPLEVVAKGMSNRLFEQTLVRARERLGMRVIPMGDAPARALKALGDGGVVAILGDQSAHRGGVPVRFFGLAASTARGPALLAVRSGAPVFLGFAVRDPGWSQRYTLTFEALQFEPSGDVDRDVDLLLERYARFLEAAIERCPEQYFWQHRRWKSQPDGGTVIEGVGY